MLPRLRPVSNSGTPRRSCLREGAVDHRPHLLGRSKIELELHVRGRGVKLTISAIESACH